MNLHGLLERPLAPAPARIIKVYYRVFDNMGGWIWEVDGGEEVI